MTPRSLGDSITQQITHTLNITFQNNTPAAVPCTLQHHFAVAQPAYRVSDTAVPKLSNPLPCPAEFEEYHFPHFSMLAYQPPICKKFITKKPYYSYSLMGTKDCVRNACLMAASAPCPPPILHL